VTVDIIGEGYRVLGKIFVRMSSKEREAEDKADDDTGWIQIGWVFGETKRVPL
jgi:hypothetical protein